MIANAIATWGVESRLQRRRASIRAAGHPASIAELAPTPLPPEQNAATYLQTLAGPIEDFNRDHARFPNWRKLVQEQATAEDFDDIRNILNKYPEIDQGVSRAAACDAYASLADFSLPQVQFIQELLRRCQDQRSYARYLSWRVAERINAQQIEEATRRGLESLRLSRLQEAELTLVGMMVSIATRTMAIQDLYDSLSAGSVSQALHEAVEQELALHDDPSMLVRSLFTERAVTLSAMDFLSGSGGSVFLSWPLKRHYLGTLDWYDLLISSAGHVSPDGLQPLNSGSQPASLSKYGPLTESLASSIAAAAESQKRSLALVRSLRVFNRLRQYTQQHGKEPRGLSDLGLATAATTDPFSGKSLLLKRTDAGWIVYSVMANGTDDGGDFRKLRDIGVAPKRYRNAE